MYCTCLDLITVNSIKWLPYFIHCNAYTYKFIKFWPEFAMKIQYNGSKLMFIDIAVFDTNGWPETWDYQKIGRSVWNFCIVDRRSTGDGKCSPTQQLCIRQTSDDSVAFIKPRLYDRRWHASPPFICDSAAGLLLPKNNALVVL
jgi:hypothetical protein